MKQYIVTYEIHRNNCIGSHTHIVEGSNLGEAEAAARHDFWERWKASYPYLSPEKLHRTCTYLFHLKVKLLRPGMEVKEGVEWKSAYRRSC